jgi:hypothetical protein
MKQLLTLTLCLTACAPAPVPPALPQIHVPAPPARADPPALVAYAAKALAVCAAPGLSPLVRQALAEDVAAVAAAAFPASEAEAQAFVVLVCIESRYDQAARSSAGAVGLTQVLPQFAAGFGRECGDAAPAAVPADASYAGANLRLGACHFRALLRALDGNVPLALASYNAGSSSTTAAKLKLGGTGAAETSGYLARHYVLTEQLRGD